MIKLPKTIAGQLILLIVSAIILSQLCTLFMIFFNTHGKLSHREEQYFFNDVVSTYKVIRSLSGVERDNAIILSSNSDIHISLSTIPLSSTPVSDDWSSSGKLKNDLNISSLNATERSITFSDIFQFWFTNEMEMCFVENNWRNLPEDCPSRIISIPLNEREWFNVESMPSPGEMFIMLPLVVSALIALVSISVAVYFAVKRITSPLLMLSEAAEKLGRGETIGPLQVSGPLELSSTTEAFNVMQERLTRFVQDRTKMLASISHDLRTPITSLRLRAEFIESDDLKCKIINTLEEMQSMVTSCLAFASQDGKKEKNSVLDLVATLQDLADESPDITFFSNVAEYGYVGRNVSLKRAIRNILENSVKYGEQAHMRFQQEENSLSITIQDKGPGIPEESMEEIFEPFVRLGKERNTESGSVGLGLAIARTIIHNHGGMIFVANTPTGLKVSVALPIV